MWFNSIWPPAHVVFEILDTAKFKLIHNQIPIGYGYYAACRSSSGTLYLSHNYNDWTCQSKLVDYILVWIFCNIFCQFNFWKSNKNRQFLRPMLEVVQYHKLKHFSSRKYRAEFTNGAATQPEITLHDWADFWFTFWYRKVLVLPFTVWTYYCGQIKQRLRDTYW